MVSLIRHNVVFIFFLILLLKGCSSTKNNTIYSNFIQNIIQKKYIYPNGKLDKYTKILDKNQSRILNEKLENKNNNSVVSLMLKDNVLYLKIKYFGRYTDHLIHRSILENETKTKGIILDLRNNSGGLLIAAITISDYFVDDNNVLKAVGRDINDTTIYKTYTQNTLSTVPIVVLVNKYTISAAEVLAGILQAHKRAILVGEKTFGKTSIQDLIFLDNGEILKLTTQKYYVLSKNGIVKKRLELDINIKNSKISKNIKMTAVKKHKIINIKTKNKDDALLVAKLLLES